MFHMLSCFDLEPGADIETFRAEYSEFVAQMKSIDLVESTGPIGRRQNDTPMDTDDERQQQYFVVMDFRDRDQVDAAYAHIESHIEPGEAAHTSIYAKAKNSIFICWQDME